MDSFSITPRLRVPRNSHLYNDRSQVASTTIDGPSRFPEQTQLLDMDMNGVAMSETTEQSKAPSSTTPPVPAGRSPTPADNLRALMMRLPATDTSSTPRAPSPAPYEFSERESDFDSDMDFTDPADAPNPPASAHDHAKALFEKARSEQSYSSRRDYSNRSPSEKSATGASMIVEGNTTGVKGKQTSFLADENSNVNPNGK
ncbi:hypothetical protein D9619_001371 [Psilocybe cf. subviscida]|uniref:Uncharacterized protein n=1 Tax=Psilocybe cf. subviscida TaxID=2480587 RepID=A0A8H5BDY9_9AGAR|nr:hypothetical protein D9619_001371 [Psilocybe cf. subviscida]